jgi:hypothetical protein
MKKCLPDGAELLWTSGDTHLVWNGWYGSEHFADSANSKDRITIHTETTSTFAKYQGRIFKVGRKFIILEDDEGIFHKIEIALIISVEKAGEQ